MTWVTTSWKHSKIKKRLKITSNTDKTAGKNGDAKPDGIVCIGVSGDYLAVCSERKELTVFHKQKPGDYNSLRIFRIRISLKLAFILTQIRPK